MAVDCLAKATDELDKAATAFETQADYQRQTAQLCRMGKLIECCDMQDSVVRLEAEMQKHVEKSAEYLRMLEVADKDFWEEFKRNDIKRKVNLMTIDEARGHLAIHKTYCRDGANCDVHTALIARIKG